MCSRAYSEALKYAPENPEIRSALQNQIRRVSREDLSEVNPLQRPEHGVICLKKVRVALAIHVWFTGNPEVSDAFISTSG